MKIDSANINLGALRSYYQYSEQQESLRAWVGDAPSSRQTAGRSTSQNIGRDPAAGDSLAQGNGPAKGGQVGSQVSISSAARAMFAEQMTLQVEHAGVQQAASGVVDGVETALDEIDNDPRMQLLITIIERLTGQKVKIFGRELVGSDEGEAAQNNAAKAKGGQTAQGGGVGAPRPNWGVEYHYRERVYEAERTDFSARGVIKTADGKELKFDLKLNMSREFMRESNVSMVAGNSPQMKDPLVINFNGPAAALTDEKFAFDIDADGQTEQISFLRPGSGFLALDKNGNGLIDDGSELFGAQTGDGFAELAQYDDDGNGWIDANDAIFAQLVIWSKDVNGNDIYTTLADHNIGAIYLDSINTPFALNNAHNQSLGQVLSTGLYLNEDGTAGTVQQIDVAV